MKMTQEEKDLVLRDLCARLPYNIIVDYESHLYALNEIDPACKDIDYITVRIQDVERLICAKSVMIENIKPYLRPMSSMTKEEEDELCELCTLSDCNVNADWECCGVEIIQTHPRYDTYFSTDYSVIDWLNKKMFDYRGLIPRGLANEAPEGMYN